MLAVWSEIMHWDQLRVAIQSLRLQGPIIPAAWSVQMSGEQCSTDLFAENHVPDWPTVLLRLGEWSYQVEDYGQAEAYFTCTLDLAQETRSAESAALAFQRLEMLPNANTDNQPLYRQLTTIPGFEDIYDSYSLLAG